MQIFLAVIIGFLFGFVLQKIGASNPDKIINMLRLKDFHIMKIILFAIGFSSIMLFTLMTLGFIDSSHLSIKSSYIGVIIGGGIMGLGWAISGFCPGTGLVAAGAGRKDALIFILGGMGGTFLYIVSYGFLKNTFLFENLGGKTTLAAINSQKITTIFSSLPALTVSGLIGLIFIGLAFLLPKNNND
jgi:uncharacterized membrane protein YedE/YeeE